MKTSLIALSSLALLGTAFAQEGGDNSQNSRPVFQGINRNPAESTADPAPVKQGANREPAESSAPVSSFRRNNGAPAESDPVSSPVVNQAPRFEPSTANNTPRFEPSTANNTPRFESSQVNNTPRFESSQVNNTPRFEQTAQAAPTPSPSAIPAPRGVPTNVTASTESAKSTFVPVPEMPPITPLAPITALAPIADQAPITGLAPIADQATVADQAPVAATAPALNSTCSTQVGAPHCGSQVQAHCYQAPAYYSEQAPHCQTYVGNGSCHVVSVCVIHSTQECRVGYDHCGRPFQYNVTLVTFQETLSDGTTRTYTREA